ncbi:MAG: GIY-YIG nuclease family protein [Balneolaceae bacterium]|nr:GIY-YIG nuclease family protein [Balneolaceae bacterium]
MFKVYALYSPGYHKIYIGFSSDLESRMRSHNELGTKGWTIKYRPWEIVFTESFASKSEAMKRERELKTAKGREYVWEQVTLKYNLI